MAFKLPARTETAAAAQAAGSNGGTQDRPQAEYWANVGYWDLIDGEEVFVSLTLGIPLDQLKPMKGNSPLAKRKNHLNEIALSAAMELEPGEAEIVQELVVQIRRVAAEETRQLAPEDTVLTRLTFGNRKAKTA